MFGGSDNCGFRLFNKPFSGHQGSTLKPEQQDKVKKVIGLWVNDTNPSISAGLFETYMSQLGDTKIAWAGSTDRTAGNSYFRIDGPRLWIDYTNTGRGGETPHCHTVYRAKKLDYGNGNFIS